MASVINTTFKLKRGTAARWAELNPVLAQGEPGFVYDENRLKVGDGITPWNDLSYIDGKREVCNFDYITDFPEVGQEDIVYKAEKEQCLYQFNTDSLKYEKISGASTGDNKTIEISAEGIVSIIGASKADSLTLPRMREDKSSIEWVPVSEIIEQDGNDNTTYEFTVLEDKAGFSIITKFNGVQIGEAVKYILNAYTKSEVEDITNTLSEKISDLESKQISIAEGDKVLQLNGSELSSTISLKHENGMISLVGANGEVISEFSDSDFIKDGMLENVKYDPETNTLTFTWNTSAGTKSESVVLTDIIEAYAAGQGLNLTGTEFSIKLDPESESFLSLGDNGLKLSGIQQAIDNTSLLYATKETVTQLESSVNNRLETLESIEYNTFVTEEKLQEVKNIVNQTSQDVQNLENSKSDHEERILDLEAFDIQHQVKYDALVEVVESKVDKTLFDLVSEKVVSNENEITNLTEITIPALQNQIDEKANLVEVYTKSEIGVIPENKTLMESIVEHITESTYDDTAVKALIESNAEAIAAINDADSGILALAQSYTNEKFNAIPAATIDTLGLVSYDDVTIKKNSDNQLYVGKITTDMIEQGSETLILHGGNAFN